MPKATDQRLNKIRSRLPYRTGAHFRNWAQLAVFTDTSRNSNGYSPAITNRKTAEQNVQLQECKRKQEFYLLFMQKQIFISMISICRNLRNLVLFFKTTQFSHLNSPAFLYEVLVFPIPRWQLTGVTFCWGAWYMDHVFYIEQMLIWPPLCAKHWAKG